LVFDVADSDTLIEAPPGFKHVALEIARRTGARVSGRPVWGSCDTGNPEGKVIHLGHGVPPNIATRLMRSLGGSIEKLDVDTYVLRRSRGVTYFIPVYYRVPPLEIPEELPSNAQIYFPVPYRLIAEELSRRLGGDLVEPPMTGCWVAKPPSEKNVVVSAGYFYPITIKLLKPDASVYGFDPFSRRVLDVDARFMLLAKLKARAWIMGEARGANVVVVVSVKPGQLISAELVRELARRVGATIVEMDEVSPELLSDLPADIIINAACPRIGFDDLDRISKPVLNIGEAIHGPGIVNVLKWPS